MLRDFHFDDESLDILYGFPGTGIEELLRMYSMPSTGGWGTFPHINWWYLPIQNCIRIWTAGLLDKLPDAESCFSMFRAAHRLLLQSGYTLQSVQEYGKAGEEHPFLGYNLRRVW